MGIAADPNCRLDNSEAVVAAISVTRLISEGEELLVDYGIEYCLRNQIPNPRAPDWARDLAAFSLLTRTSKQLTALKTEIAFLEEQLAAGSITTSGAKHSVR